MNCDQIQARLSEYLDDRLDPASRREIEEHLASCPRCLPEAKQLRDGIKMVAGLPEVEPPAGFSQRVMARVREEAAGPTLWERLFQPLRIKLPLHAAALLLVVGLAVYLHQANGPAKMEVVQSISPEVAPALKQAPSTEERASADLAQPPTAPSERSFADSQQTPPAEVDRMEPSAREDRAGPAPPPAQERMAIKETPSGEAKLESALSAAGAPLGETREQQMKEVLSKKESPSPPDILLTLLTRGKADGTIILSAKVREIVQRNGGTLHSTAERDDPGNDKPRFRLDLPKSEYDRFKAELTQVGEIISESQPASPPQTDTKPSALMRIELTFLFDKSKEGGAAGPAPTR